MNIEQYIQSILSIKPDSVLLQIGANDGVQDDYINKIVKKFKIRSHLIEPVPVFYNELENEYSDCDFVTTYNIAISNHNGYQDITYVDYHNSSDELPVWTKGLGTFDESKNGFSGFGNFMLRDDLRNTNIYKNIVKNKTSIPVKTQTLNSFLSEQGIQEIDFYISDTEGYDGIIFEQLDIKRYQPKLLIMETHSLGIDAIKAIDSRLLNSGYLIDSSPLVSKDFCAHDTIACIWPIPDSF